jgi:hypothetical protein
MFPTALTTLAIVGSANVVYYVTKAGVMRMGWQAYDNRQKKKRQAFLLEATPKITTESGL